MTFLTHETGAVTVDWVVLTAGLVGLGLAAMTVVSSGVQDASGDTKAQMEGQIIYSSFGFSTESFAGGAAGWTGATTSHVAGLGDVLGPIPGASGLEAVQKVFEIPEGTEEATLTFDLFAMDSLDSTGGGFGTDTAHLYIDGQAVATGTPVQGTGGMTWEYHDVAGVNVAVSEVQTGAIGGSPGHPDGQHSVTITVDNPSEDMTFGFGSNANQDVSDESYSIDNVSIQTAGLGQ